MPNRYRGANDEMRDALARVAPGTPLRDGIDRVVRAKAGALLVIVLALAVDAALAALGRLLTPRGVHVVQGTAPTSTQGAAP